MINTSNLYNEMNFNFNENGYLNRDNIENLKLLNDFIKNYTIEKLFELGYNFEDISKHNTMSGLLHLLDSSLVNHKNEVFNNYIFTILNFLGNIQQFGILWQTKEGKSYQGNPSLELNDAGDISIIKTDESCSPVNNTIYVYKLLNKTILNKKIKTKSLVRK